MIGDKWSIAPATMEKVLDKVERFAGCYDFSNKELLQIRLLCEETLSVLMPALELSAGYCWIQTDAKGFSFAISCSANSYGLSEETRDKLLKMGKEKPKGGIFGAIGRALDALLNPEYPSGGFDATYMSAMSYPGMGGYHYAWIAEQDSYTLSAQQSAATTAKRDEDGLEISIVEGYADDIKATVKPGGRLEMMVTKFYSKKPVGVEFE